MAEWESAEMVDKEKRLKGAESIEKLISCQITNYEYDDQFPRSEDDPALHAIYTALWFPYLDVGEHRMDGKHALTPQAREAVDRCVLFLKTDVEYTGPTNFSDLTTPFKRLWNFIIRKKPKQVPRHWPFETREQLQAARAKLN